jgi:glycosyltransferase involved in cell wall biosynthesis
MDLVHAHHPFLSARLALRYCRPFNIPIAFTNHTRYDLYAQAYLPALPDQIGTAFLQAYMPWLCREVDLVIAPSAGLQRVLAGLASNPRLPCCRMVSTWRRSAGPTRRWISGRSA